MSYKYTIETDDGEIQLEIEITHHEPFVPATRDDPGYGGDIDYDIIYSSRGDDFVPDEQESRLILEFLGRQLEIEADQVREDFELRVV